MLGIVIRSAARRRCAWLLPLLASAAAASAAIASSPGAARGGDVIFAEDFESGDLLGWSNTTGGPPYEPLPPDPAQIAPPLDPSLPLDPFESSRFLWEANPPVQTQVEPGALAPDRIALIRGRALRRGGSPLRAVRVSALGQPDVGSTLTRADGVFDLAIRGGGEVTLEFKKPGFLPLQRRVEALRLAWATVEDVVMIPFDEQVAAISSGATEMQVARGSLESDEDGPRQATLFFREGTEAEMLLEGGAQVPLPLLHVRMTEYTVGDDGPAAMPGSLPPQVGYTYAVELSADEAVAAGATSVLFSDSVVAYVENFLQFPVGDPVPVAFLERESAAWIPERDGRIVQILSEVGGMAELDIDGSGTPAGVPALEELGIGTSELQRLAVLYEPGQSFWRVEIPHFSPWDFNWPAGPPEDAEPPPDPEAEGESPPDDPIEPEGPPDPDGYAPDQGDPVCEPGSILECENQVLRERLALVGVPFSLHYSSDRVKGRSSPLRFSVGITGADPPASLLRADLRIEAAGQVYRWGIASPGPNLRHTLTWNLVDRYLRPIHAEEPATIVLTYTYPLVYYTARGPWEQSFSRLPIEDTVLPGWRQASRFTIRRTLRTTIGALARNLVGPWDLRGEGLGGWSFDVYHRYHPRTGTLFPGRGGRQLAHERPIVAPRILGTGIAGSSGDGGPGRLARLEAPTGLALAPDGSLYVADSEARTIRRLRPDGIVEAFAGNGDACEPGGPGEGAGDCGDGGPAIDGSFVAPGGLSVAGDGSLLIADGLFVRRVDPDGFLSTVAGLWISGPPPHGSGEPCADCIATEVELGGVTDVVAQPDGSFFLAESGSHRVSFVAADGRLSVVAGDGIPGSSGDGGPAALARLSSPTGLTLGPEGEIYIADWGNHRIRRIGTNGVISTVAGTGASGFSGDGGPAVAAELSYPRRVAVGADGVLYVVDQFNLRVRRISSSGRIQTVVGSDAPESFRDGDLALQIPLDWPADLAIEPRGRLLVADEGAHHVLEVTDARPLPHDGELLIPNSGGSQVFVFSPSGRHLRTVHALTGATLLSFEYDVLGRLHRIVDGDGNATEVLRDGSGAPTAIVGPYGQASTLTLDSFGYLSGVTNPAGESTTFSSTTTGLLLSRTDAESHSKSFFWDSTGRLVGELDADGGHKTLSRWGVGDRTYTHYRVAFGSAEGRNVFHDTWYYWNGRRRWKSLLGLAPLLWTPKFAQDRAGGVRCRSGDGSTRRSFVGTRCAWQRSWAI